MKYFLPALLLLISTFCYSQKYILIDKRMTQPISFTNTVTQEHSYKNLFPVEKEKISQFIAELEKIGATLSNKKTQKPEAIDVSVGKTKFIGVIVPLSAEERLDVALTTDCDGIKVSMHLSDAKLSNARNAFFINTWIKYIKDYLK